MNASEIHILSKPKLNSSTFILSLSDQYGVNNIVAQALIEHTRSEKFAELHSPHFPDYVIAEETGLCHLPRYDLYASESFNPNTIIMTGDVRPSPEDGRAHYEIFSLTFNFARDMGCRRFLSLGTFQGEGAEATLYVAATTGRLASSITRRLGGKPLAGGSIDGLIGIILGLAKVHGLPALCVLGPSGQNIPREDTAQAVFHYVTEVLRLRRNRG